MEVEKPSFLQGQPHISRANGLPRKVHSKQTQSISTTTPVCQIRICSAFCRSESVSAQTKPGENPRKGAAAPFLVVLRGFAKGEIRNSPFAILSFDRQRRFLSHMRKKAGLKTPLRKHSVTSQCLGTSTSLPPIYGWRHFGICLLYTSDAADE